VSGVVDPLASIRAWTLEVEIAGREYTIAPRLAGEWLAILLDEVFDASLVLPGMLSDEDAEELEEALLDRRVSSSEVTDAALDVVAMAAGRPWWWTLRLSSVLSAHWLTVYGHLTSQGLDINRMTLGSFLDAAYYVCLTMFFTKPEQRLQFNRDLETPPVGQKVELNEEQEAANFLALMNSNR